MSNVGLLIFFAVAGAFICAKARVAAGAVVFSLVALILFISTPVGNALPGALSSFFSAVDQATTPVLNGAEATEDGGGQR